MTEEKKQTVLERGLDAKKFIEAPIYQKVLNSLIDECHWCMGIIQNSQEKKRERRCIGIVTNHQLLCTPTLQSWVASMEQEQAQELDEPKNNTEIH